MPKINSSKSPIVPQLKGFHLFHFDGAPCAQRVRFALGEKKLSRGKEEQFNASSPSSLVGEEGHWVSRIVSLPKKQHMTQDYAQIHPNMVVPALVHDGTLFLESMDIIEYLDQVLGGAPLIPTAVMARQATMARVEQAKELHLSLRYVTFHWGLGRLAMLNKKEQQSLKQLASHGADDENLVAFYQAYSHRTISESIFTDHLIKLYQAFQELDQQMQDGRSFVMGETLTIADAFWAMKVLRLIETGYPFSQYHPTFYQWYQRIYNRSAFQNEVMGKNRLNHRFFRIKSSIENALGKGLKHALNQCVNNHQIRQPQG